MSNEVREPAGTIRAELGRRRQSEGRLAAASGMSQPRLKRRLDDPDSFQLGELAVIATALAVPVETLLSGWIVQAAEDADTPRDAA